jgi:hypothetical protein
MGFGDPEAGNLTALASGIGITSQPWTVREVAHLLFVLELHRVCRLWSGTDDRADGSEGSRVPAPVHRAPAPPVVDKPPIQPVQPGHRGDVGSSDGRVTLLTLFRWMAGPSATLDQLRRSSPDGRDTASGSDGQGG